MIGDRYQQQVDRRGVVRVGKGQAKPREERTGSFRVPTVCVLLLALTGFCVPGNALAVEDLLERGRYVFNAAGCVACHTSGQPLAGGRPIVTPFGTFYSSNITPDRKHGIGTWAEEDFIRALREGVSPRGKHYYPAFPYTSYTGMTREDMLALRVYLMSQPAVPARNRPHEIPWFLSSRTLLEAWKRSWFTPGAFSGDPTKSPEWNRGAYLATALGHCGECHTPRGIAGASRSDRYLAGTRKGPEGVLVPNITPHSATGIGTWGRQDLIDFLNTGRRPDGHYTGGLMMEVLGTSGMHLSAYDKNALVTYLRSLSPVHRDVYFEFDPFADTDYLDH